MVLLRQVIAIRQPATSQMTTIKVRRSYRADENSPANFNNLSINPGRLGNKSWARDVLKETEYQRQHPQRCQGEAVQLVGANQDQHKREHQYDIRLSHPGPAQDKRP